MQRILQYTPQNLLVAALLVLILYAVKSATVIFPIIVLEVVVGHLFPFEIAIVVNLLGGLICLTIPYWMGQHHGVDLIEKLMRKYPRFERILEKQQDNSFFLCFWLRIISFLPGDVVSMYLGATQASFIENVVGGMMGLLPGMFLATLLGSSIRDVHSPAFWISTVLMVMLSGLSFVFYVLYQKYAIKEKTGMGKE